MPDVIAHLIQTLDGHTTGPKGPFDMSCIAPHGVTDQAREHLLRMTEAPVILLGRCSYEGYRSYWPAVADDSSADPRDRSFATWLNEVEKVVFSRTLSRVDWTNAHLADAEPAEVAASLRDTARGDIRVPACMSIIRQLLAADEVDVLEVTIAPTVTGGGGVLFTDGTPASQWRLSAVTPTDSGAVRIDYRRSRTEVA